MDSVYVIEKWWIDSSGSSYLQETYKIFSDKQKARDFTDNKNAKATTYKYRVARKKLN